MKKILTTATIIILVIAGGIALAGCNKNDEIKVYTRDTSSGTRDGFFGAIGFSEAKKDDSVLVDGVLTDGNSEIISAVEKDENAIGYISLSSLSTKVKGVSYNGVEATEANVNSGDYKLSRNFNYMLRDDYNDLPNGVKIEQISKAFVAYMSTKQGKATIANKGGIVDINTGDNWDSIKGNHEICVADNSNITIKFGGSGSVEKIATALSTDFKAKCGNFTADHNHTGSSNAYKGLNGDNKAASDGLSIHIGFASREFKDSETATTKGKLATDAIVVIVNKENDVENLTAEQIKKIYKGEIKNWSEIK